MRAIINTERLVLRPLVFADAPAFARHANDYDIAKMTGSFPYPFPLLSVEFKIMYLMSQRECGLSYPYAITIEGQDLMGIMDIFRSDDTTAFEIGYWIGRPFWKRGYVSEAAKAILNEARETLKVSTITAGVFNDNPASQRVLEKLGFKVLGPSAPYFSNARMKNTAGIDLELSFDDAL